MPQTYTVPYPWVPRFPGPYRWVSTARLAADAVKLAALLPPDVSRVIGIPRSGMIPAAVVATHRHLPLWELTPDGPRRLAHGGRGKWFGDDGGRAVIVDDTVFSGGAMGRARKLMPDALCAAVYVRPEARAAVDLCAEMLPAPHFLEWNFPNNSTVRGLSFDPHWFGGVAWDLDGIIVHDELSGGQPGAPYLVPRTHAVKLIATGRAERHRGITEELLRSLGVAWDRLEMLPDAEPFTVEAAALHKARHFRESDCGIFIESCPVQATLIRREVGRPVVCPAAESACC